MKKKRKIDRILADILALEPDEQVQLWHKLEQDHPGAPILGVFRILRLIYTKQRMADQLAELNALRDLFKNAPINHRLIKHWQLVHDKRIERLTWSEMKKKYGSDLQALRQRERRALANFVKYVEETIRANLTLDRISTEIGNLAK